jgi:hypothetical protein
MHVRDQDLEMYLLDRLQNGETPKLESHLAECDDCAMRLSSVAFFDQLVELSRKQAVLGGAEKRREPRVATQDSGVLQTITPFSADRLNITVLDISKNGMRVAAPIFMYPGTTVKVRLKSMMAFGDVRYCRRFGYSFHAGIQLYDALQV